MKSILFVLTTFLLFNILMPTLNAQLLWGDEGIPARRMYSLSWYGGAVKSTSGDNYVVWQDNREGLSKIYAQKFNPQGVQMWTEEVELLAFNEQVYFSIYSSISISPTSDSGLAMISLDFTSAADLTIKAQKIDSSGNILWGEDGIVVGTILWDEYNCSYPNIVSDNVGGIIVTWFDINSHQDHVCLLAKRILANGNTAPGWNERGNLIKDEVYSANYYFTYTCSDDADGIIVTWVEYAGHSNENILVQRVDSTGNLLWNQHGVRVCSPGNYSNPQIARDGLGGALIVWNIDGFLEIQRVDAGGALLWGANGIRLVPLTTGQYDPQIINDGFGGALIAWEDERNGGFNPDIYCQRVNGNGSLLWPIAGVVLSTMTGYQQDVKITGDGLGGLFAVWEHWLSGNFNHQSAYIQHITANGLPAWQANGLLLAPPDTLNNVGSENIISTNDDGVLAFWLEARGDINGLFLQKTDANGNFQYHPSGETIVECLAGVVEGYQVATLTPDRFLTVWTDTRTELTVPKKVYYQIFDAEGDTLLTENGVSICENSNFKQQSPTLTVNSEGETIIAWLDYRENNSSRIYAQKIDAEGNILWNPMGVQVASGTSAQYSQLVCPDETGGAFIAWKTWGLYFQHLDSDGHQLLGAGGIPISARRDETLVSLFSDREGGAIALFHDYCYMETLRAVRILSNNQIAWTRIVYSVTYTVYEIDATPSANGGAVVVRREHHPGTTGYDIYAQKFDNEGNLLWGEDGVPVINLRDSQIFPRVVEDDSGFVYVGWSSGIHNLYDIYCQRLTSQGERLFPITGLPVCTSDYDQVGFDIVTDGSDGAIFSWYTQDTHYNSLLFGNHLNSLGQPIAPWAPNGNRISGNWNPGMPTMTTDSVGGAVVAWAEIRGLYLQRINDNLRVTDGEINAYSLSPSSFIFYPCFPNPFNSTAVIRFQLSDASQIELKVFDISGREVASIVNPLASGWSMGEYSVVWDAEGLPSGIYFVKLAVDGGQSAVRKVVLMK